MALPANVRKYVLAAINGTPDVLDGFLKSFPANDPIWDFRPDPARFTLREVLAHLADWNPIFHGRMVRTRDEDTPDLEDIDEGQVAIENDYAHSDPLANLTRFRETRVTMVAFLRTLEESDWQRVANRIELGHITIEGQAVLVAAHDGYHTQQVAQWLEAARR